jgi:hypothetical protein
MNDQWFYFLNLELLCLEKNIIFSFSSIVQLAIYGQGRIFETMRPMLAVFIAIIHSFKLVLTLMIYTTNINFTFVVKSSLYIVYMTIIVFRITSLILAYVDLMSQIFLDNS